METNALRFPVAVGANVTLITHVPCAATLLTHVLVWEKSPEFVPPTATLVMLRLAVPVLVSVTFCAGLVLPIFCATKVRLGHERLTTGVGVGAGVPPPLPPPQAAQAPTNSTAIANSEAAERHRVAVKLMSIPRASNPATTQVHPTGRRKLGGTFRCIVSGVERETAVVVTVNVADTVDEPDRLTDEGEMVHVAPGGHPEENAPTVAFHPYRGVSVNVEVPDRPGAQMLMDEGLADTLKSAAVAVVATAVVEAA
jgi:hypothetical protein